MRYIILDIVDIRAMDKEIITKLDNIQCVIKFPNGGIPLFHVRFLDYTWAEMIVKITNMGGWPDMTQPQNSRDVREFEG